MKLRRRGCWRGHEEVVCGAWHQSLRFADRFRKLDELVSGFSSFLRSYEIHADKSWKSCRGRGWGVGGEGGGTVSDECVVTGARLRISRACWFLQVLLGMRLVRIMFRSDIHTHTHTHTRHGHLSHSTTLPSHSHAFVEKSWLPLPEDTAQSRPSSGQGNGFASRARRQ